MALLLYINGQLTDLEPGQQIAQTRQVNDLNSLDDRQASYTNKFKLPKTATNLKIFNFLGVTGNTSSIPYQKNLCSLYSDSGECFVYNGMALITDGGDNFEAVLYDGIIDLYKAIENTPLSAVGLESLNHMKGTAEIINSWQDTNPPYRYILADYNGNNGNTNTVPYTVNIDYLVPSVNVKYLWDRIFNHYEFTYSGAVFNTERFKNLWLTFPKGISNGDDEQELFVNSYNLYQGVDTGSHVYTYYTVMTEYEAQEGITLTDNRHITVTEPGYYRLDIDGNLRTISYFGSGRRAKVFIGKNSAGLAPNAVQQVQVIADNIYCQQDFAGQALMYLGANESVCVIIAKATYDPNYHGFIIDDPTSVNVRLIKVNQNEYDFNTAFADFSVKDFLTEVVHRFGLTIFKDKYKNHYRFLTLQEQLQSPRVLDWSNRFVKKVSEKYIYGSYARRNWLRYAYNDKESSHHDGYIDVANENLPDNRDVIKSRIYAPELQRALFLNRPTNVYKLWDKEPIDNPEPGEATVDYKSLDKRYYFLRCEYSGKDVTLFSEKLGGSLTAADCWVEQFWRLGFGEIADDYYSPLRQLLDKSAIVTAEMYLSDADVANFDFSSLIYIEQLASYFIMNKINNFVQGRPVKCELVRVNLAEAAPVPPPLKITKVVVSHSNVLVYFDLHIMVSTINLQVKNYNSPGAWSNWQGSASSPRYISFTPTGNFTLRLQSGNEYSNEVEITVDGGIHVIEVE